MARCTDCDTPLTALDRAAMQAVNDEAARYITDLPYPDTEDATVRCADCIADRAERAQARRDEDYYGGDSPTLAETAAYAQRFK